MGSSKEYIPPPPPKIAISWGGGGYLSQKKLKKCMKLKWNFQRGWEVLEKILSTREVWIFSGTIQTVDYSKKANSQ